MKDLLSDPKYDFIVPDEKAFVIAFDQAMAQSGYESNGIQPYVCLGRYKIEYCKAGLKTKRYVARFYFRDSGLVFRLYFSNIDKHREHIENAPEFIRAPFTNDVGRCKQCDKNGGCIGKKGQCSFKKSYTIGGSLYEKCAGENYYFDNLDLSSVPQYMELLNRFYPSKKPAEGTKA